MDEAAVRDTAGRAYDRAHDPLGMARQAVAVVVSGDRTQQLRSLTVPTPVIHCAADRMINVSGGRATAAAIPGAALGIVEAMGHDLARPPCPEFARTGTPTKTRSQRRRCR
jgi:pimeloyl-ACP methyl ester carboxylesterase